jgi:glycosyltransferase involved in cell wall biosynthesis
VPARDASSLASAINRLLADECLRQRMGEAGRIRARTEFGADVMVERIVQVYRSLHVPT